MIDDDLPKAVHEGSLTLAGVAIRTYVLDDGRRILDQQDMAALYRAVNGGAEVKPEEAQAYAEFVGRDPER